ncbi:MAG: iron-containing alcohol dehydrogenase [Defluviitaleaceae bacterium]|nr:iron-containing alcohol dehydrogenase [Defluviitaleaceae bacterium]
MTNNPIITKVANSQTILLQWLKDAGHSNILTVADTNTAVFAKGERLLTLSPTPDNSCLIPDETAIGKILIAAAGMQAIVAVGSGTICDLVRYVSSRLGLTYYVVATAASMDGYTSSVSALIVDSVKQTYPATAPAGVITDPSIYETAPTDLVSAGFGDMMGKFTSVTDWEMEGLLYPNAGDFCQNLATEMRSTAESCCKDKETMNALIKSGLIMQKAGHSKPASGSEHHLSHFWEMRGIPALHGTKVGVATLVVLQAQEWLLTEDIDWTQKEFNLREWTNDIHRCYGPAANDIIKLWPDENTSTRAALIERIRNNWSGLRKILSQNVGLRPKLEKAIADMGGAISPTEIGIDQATFISGVLHSNRLRRRFTTWRLLDLLGLLSLYAKRLFALPPPPLQERLYPK